MGSDQIRLLYPKKLVFVVGRYLLLLHAGDHLAGRKESKDGAEIIKEAGAKSRSKTEKETQGRSDAFD